MLWDQETWFCYRKVKHTGAVGSVEFLSYINEAKCVVTNSFHATAFSIILNTPFNMETEIERKDRILNILKIFELKAFGLVKGQTKSEMILPQIEWGIVNSKVQNERQESLNYIDRILK